MVNDSKSYSIFGFSQNLWIRIFSALVILPAAGFFLVMGGWYFLSFIAVLAGVMTWEMATVMFGRDRPWFIVLTIFGGFLTILLIGIKIDSSFIMIFNLCWVGGLLITSFFNNLLNLVIRFLFYNMFIIVPCCLILWLRQNIELNLVFWILVSVISTDIGAYIAGKTIGGIKLAPKISPNKTWSGLLGGIVASVMAGVLFGFFILDDLLRIVIFSIIIAIISQMGDLLESSFKRKYSIKESSNLIPGHGGVMDRLDGHMGAVTFMAVVSFLSDKVIVL
jgi:phosphatidate cytidylyltransferase